MKEIIIGIDIGTSACKVVAFSVGGEVVAQASESYRVYYPRPGWAEQDPREWWTSVCKAIRRVLSQGVAASEIKTIGVDGQSWSAIPVDARGEVLCRTPIWMDQRSEEICARLRTTFGEERLFAVHRNPVQPMYTMPKVLWYRKELPDVYCHTHKILQSNGFIVYRLTGELTQDPSQGYGWNCYDVAKGEWDAALCREMGVDPNLLPDLVPCHCVVGGVTEAAAEQTGLNAGTPVVAGGLDAACGTLGAGVLHPGEIQEQGGQAGGMSICMDRCCADKRLILGNHVVPGLWLLQGGTVGGGGALNWFEREFGAAERAAAQTNGTHSFQELDAAAEKAPPGSGGLLFLPYLAGERSPIWDTNAKGVFYGISFSTARTQFARAVMEGVAYSLRHNLEVAERAGAVIDTLSATGGAANSFLWTQIKADITGKPIVVPSSDTSTALGAALLAGVGAGIYRDFESAVQATVRINRKFFPNPQTKPAYDQGYRHYRNLYENLKLMMSEA